METVLCDKHPLQKMDRVEFSKEGKVETDGFKCPQCTRIYILAGDLGYLDFVNKQMVLNTSSQLRCSEHKSPLFLARFELNGDESLREWRCAHGMRKEVKTTIGENYLAESAA
jgi:hypothetical protein